MKAFVVKEIGAVGSMEKDKKLANAVHVVSTF